MCCLRGTRDHGSDSGREGCEGDARRGGGGGQGGGTQRSAEGAVVGGVETRE
jgi:hypothetical protein